MGNDKKEANGNTNDVKAEADDEDDDEMEDDALMSEQFVVKNEEKEKEKLALLKSRAANTHKYIFDIINGRMIEISRRFYQYIAVADLGNIAIKNENDIHYQQIADSIQSIAKLTT